MSPDVQRREETVTPVIIGICGGTASGKTTLADAIYKSLDGDDNVAIIHHDQYYKKTPPQQKDETTVNYDHPDALDTDLLVTHLEGLKKGLTVEVPLYDYASEDRFNVLRELLSPKRVILVEGIMCLVDERLRELMDLTIFVDVNADVRLFRRLDRDVNERGRQQKDVFEQYINVIQPMHDAYVEPSKKFADFIVNDAENPVVLDVLVNHLRAVGDGC